MPLLRDFDLAWPSDQAGATNTAALREANLAFRAFAEAMRRRLQRLKPPAPFVKFVINPVEPSEGVSAVLKLNIGVVRLPEARGLVSRSAPEEARRVAGRLTLAGLDAVRWAGFEWDDGPIRSAAAEFSIHDGPFVIEWKSLAKVDRGSGASYLPVEYFDENDDRVVLEVRDVFGRSISTQEIFSTKDVGLLAYQFNPRSSVLGDGWMEFRDHSGRVLSRIATRDHEVTG